MAKTKIKIWHVAVLVLVIGILASGTPQFQGAIVSTDSGTNIRLAYPVVKNFECSPSGPEQSYTVNFDKFQVKSKLYCTNNVYYDDVSTAKDPSADYSIPKCDVYLMDRGDWRWATFWGCNGNSCTEIPHSGDSEYITSIGQTGDYDYMMVKTSGFGSSDYLELKYTPYGLYSDSTVTGRSLAYPTCNLEQYLIEQGHYDWIEEAGGENLVNGIIGFTKSMSIIEYWNDVALPLNIEMKQSAYNPTTGKICLDHYLWSTGSYVSGGTNYIYPKNRLNSVACCPGEIVGNLMCSESYEWNTNTGELENTPCNSDLELPDVPLYGQDKLEKWDCVNGVWKSTVVEVECLENADCPNLEGMVGTCIDYECRYAQSSEIEKKTIPEVVGLGGLANFLNGFGINLDSASVMWLVIIGVAALILLIILPPRNGGFGPPGNLGRTQVIYLGGRYRG